jgi:hypothetical protein
MKKYVLKDTAGNYYKNIISHFKDPIITTKNKDEAHTFATREVAGDFIWLLSVVHDHKFDLEELT